MSTVNPIPEGCEGFIPHLVVEGGHEALAFYQKAFGAEVLMTMPAPDGKRIMHAEFQVAGAIVYLADAFPEFEGGKCRSAKALGGSPVAIHRYVKDVDAVVAQAVAAGATITMPVTDMFWGDRYGGVQDPFGHSWSFATHMKDLTPEEIGKAQAEAFASGNCGGDAK